MRYITHSFFKFILLTFGVYPMKLMKLWTKQRKNVIKSKYRIKFLKFCIEHNIVPQHLYQIQRHNINVKHFESIKKYNRLKDCIMVKILKIELNEAFRNLHQAKREILQLARQIARHIPAYICDSFFEKQERFLHTFLQKEKKTIDKKIKWLHIKHRKNLIKHIKTIEYFCTYNNNNLSTNKNNKNDKFEHPTYSLFPPLNNHQQTIEINIDPSTIVMESSSSLYSFRNKWLINLSKIDIPQNIQYLLQLGHNFSLPALNTKNNIIELIKNIENNIRKLNIDIQSNVRNYSIQIINKLFNGGKKSNKVFERLSYLIKTTKHFIKNHPNLIFTRADKGSITVALDKNEYITKIENMLQDQETYTRIKKNPINKITILARNLLTNWKKSGFITEDTYKKLYCSDGILPRAYGLPKIHKPDKSYRIIVSSIDSPLYSLANFLQDIITKNIPKTVSHIDNSFQLVKQLNEFTLESGFDLISLDAISLFTNIPVELAIESISNRWTHISSECNIPKKEFLAALQLIMDSTFFTFNNKFYRQNFGTPMGSPLSPIIANIVLQDLERKALDEFGIEVPFYYRYVDDIATAVHRTQQKRLLNIFNSFHPRIQFTMEIGGTSLNFLDVTIINNDNRIEFDWFHKPTFSGRYLNFLSAHPLSHKRGSLMNMVDRAFLLSHPKYHTKNLEFIINTFVLNDYPLDFIFNTMNSRLRTLIKKRGTSNNKNCNTDERITWFTVPYFQNISGKNLKTYLQIPT